ncbi:MAG: hypothetical protein Q4A54_12390, partial [Parabacteroides sp.]|nr:hypothetical protein [Parabacteroides sp.]
MEFVGDEMNILHYSLGIYPDRQGGLVRYSTDLAIQQAKENNVYYLVPGKLGIIDKKVRVVKGEDYKGLKVFKIDNALPIPLFAGIKDIDLYTRQIDQTIFERFFRENRVDVVHIHSLMGLHKEFLLAAQKMGIPVFMTTHDFFGICPITTLYRDGDVCNNKCVDNRCFECSQFAHGYYKLAIGQSTIYKKLKNTALVASMRKDALADTASEITSASDENAQDYSRLDAYYRDCFSLISCFLFNSKQTREVFEERLGALPGEVIPLLLPTIRDNRRKREFFKDGILHIGYMGECKDFKGFFLLEEAVKELASEGYKIELDVFNESANEGKAVVRKGKYTADQLDEIYNSLDLIAVPSIWHETLSFIA